ncbi:MAG TPA: hypothetical protein ENN31_00750 [Candidatus Vogelbacteria bacterium]|nr:hypothetical protein [Candidatus Vogelbacteria bacterium]
MLKNRLIFTGKLFIISIVLFFLFLSPYNQFSGSFLEVEAALNMPLGGQIIKRVFCDNGAVLLCLIPAGEHLPNPVIFRPGSSDLYEFYSITVGAHILGTWERYDVCKIGIVYIPGPRIDIVGTSEGELDFSWDDPIGDPDPWDPDPEKDCPCRCDAEGEDETRAALRACGISFNKGPCRVDGQCALPSVCNCTNLRCLPRRTVRQICALAEISGCTGDMVITGGTECGHSTHAECRGIVDFRHRDSGSACLTDYIENEANKDDGDFTDLGQGRIGREYRSNNPNFPGRFLDEQRAGYIRHWHVEFR